MRKPDRFSETWVAAATAPEGKRELVIFEGCGSGLGLRVQRSGARSFFLRATQHDGQRHHIRLGSWPTLTVAAAQRAAKVAAGEIAKGVDLNARHAEAVRKANAPKALTLAGLVDKWSAGRLASLRPSYGRLAERAIRRIFAKLLSKPAASLVRREVRDLLDEAAVTRGRPMARVAAASLAACLAWAVKRDLLELNPLHGFELPASSPPRERALSVAEVRRVWQALGGLAHPGGPVAKLILLTAARRAEIGGLRWDELHDLDDPALARIELPAGPRTKTGGGHVIPLAPEAVAIIKGVPRVVGSPFVFKSRSRQKGFDDFARLKMALDAAIGEPALPGWTWHDLRRTVVSILASAPHSVSPIVCDRLLGHQPTVLSSVARIYQRAELLDERREALALWAGIVAASGEVVPLHKVAVE